MYKVALTKEAKDALKNIAKGDEKSARLIIDHLYKLPQTFLADPFLKGARFKGLRRHRCGDFRCIYRVAAEGEEIRVIAIGHRRFVYD